MFTEVEYSDIERQLALEQVSKLDHNGDYYVSKAEQIAHWLYMYAPSLVKAEAMLARLQKMDAGEWQGAQSDARLSIFFSTKDRLIAEQEGFAFAEGPTLDDLVDALRKQILKLKMDHH